MSPFSAPLVRDGVGERPGGTVVCVYLLTLRTVGKTKKKKQHNKKERKLLAVDHSARASMKNAASCEN